MKHTYFKIQNFKGIESLRLDLDTAPESRVITLVGLNESGKTTILEALNYYKHKPRTLEPLRIPGYQISDPHEIIPVGRRSNFTDETTIEAGYILSEMEQKELAEFIESDLKLVTERSIETFGIVFENTFKDTKFIKSRSYYTGLPKVKRKRGKNFGNWKDVNDEWAKLDAWLTSRLPPIVYFPNFLFDFPERIYLEAAPSATDEPLHKFYRLLLQRILSEVDSSLDLTTHIVDRAKSKDPNDARALRSVLAKIGGHVTRTVFEAWNSVFMRKHVAKEIVFEVEEDENGAVYLQFQIKDGVDLFAISERSLGFRWFFTFLLLTQYLARQEKTTDGQLFLFDEPASNLHSSAQAQLLNSFERFHPESRIMYTTHSHHLINPMWLESAYVVKNAGLTYDDEDAAYNARESKIVIDRYRRFAAQHPDQTTYYQPILDVLEYRPSNLELALDAVFFEGKNDSYTFGLAALQNKTNLKEVSLMPGTGSGNLDTLIRLYLGWGRRFVVVLDADKAGVKEKARYEKLFGNAVVGRILTLEDLDSSLAGARLEDVVPAAEREKLQERCYPGTSSDKNLYNRALQELLLKGDKSAFSPGTAKKFDALVKEALEALNH